MYFYAYKILIVAVYSGLIFISTTKYQDNNTMLLSSLGYLMAVAQLGAPATAPQRSFDGVSDKHNLNYWSFIALAHLIVTIIIFFVLSKSVTLFNSLLILSILIIRSYSSIIELVFSGLGHLSEISFRRFLSLVTSLIIFTLIYIFYGEDLWSRLVIYYLLAVALVDLFILEKFRNFILTKQNNIEKKIPTQSKNYLFFEIKGIISILGGFIIFGLPSIVFHKLNLESDARLYSTAAQIINLGLLLPSLYLSYKYNFIASFAKRSKTIFEQIKIIKAPILISLIIAFPIYYVMRFASNFISSAELRVLFLEAALPIALSCAVFTVISFLATIQRCRRDDMTGLIVVFFYTPTIFYSAYNYSWLKVLNYIALISLFIYLPLMIIFTFKKNET